MQKRLRWITIVVAAALPLSCEGCEPILPLMQLLGGGSLLGPAYLTKSLLWLFAAIAVKCASFAIFERGLPWRKSVLFMALANALSTIPGIVIAALTASMAGVVWALPLIFLLGFVVERRLLSLPGKRPWMSGGRATLAFVGFFIVATLVYESAERALDTHGYVNYWILKVVFVTLVASTGMLISAVLEECLIAILARKSRGNTSYYKSVFRANYITLALVLLVAALEILPKRLHSPHFIAAFLHLV